MEEPDGARAAKRRAVLLEGGEQGSMPVLAAAASDFALRKVAVHAICHASVPLFGHLSGIFSPESEKIEGFLALAQPLLPLLVAGPTTFDGTCSITQVIEERAPEATCVVVSAKSSPAMEDLLVAIKQAVQSATGSSFKLPGTKPRDMQTFLERKKIETKLQQPLILIVESLDKFVRKSDGRLQPKLSNFLRFFSTLMVQSPLFKMIVKLQSPIQRDRLFPLFEDPAMPPSYAVTFPEFCIKASIRQLELAVDRVLNEGFAIASCTLFAPTVLELVVRKTIAGTDVGSNMRLAIGLLVRTAECAEKRATASEQLFISMKDVFNALKPAVAPPAG